MWIPFNAPFMTGREIEYISQAHANRHLAGNGQFTQKCQQWLCETLGCQAALLTHSCTAALEMAAILAEIEPGDEVIMPSYTFVSTANAFVLRGGVPVFVDVRPDTLNLNETRIERAITTKTKAIVVVHYAGVPAEMNSIMEIARRYHLLVIEDAAQAVLSTYRGRPAGSIGHLAAVSFHETKNLMSGEGGALLINDESFQQRAEIIWEKGTNRKQFLLGEVDKYSWVDVGSSFLPSELVAAFLYAQLETGQDITRQRLDMWDVYHAAFEGLERQGSLRRPVVPDGCAHNAHMYYVLLPHLRARNQLLAELRARGIASVFHYVPLHSSPAGRRYARAVGKLPVTDNISERLLRLPIWVGMTTVEQDLVIDTVRGLLSEASRAAA
jgi:dTDP-4-amino-4,6-dideoxygalactose transaminase